MRDYDDDSDASFDTRKKRCYKHRVLPPTEICTRGGDRPRFGFERLTHQKILLGSPRKKHKRTDVTEVGFTSGYVILRCRFIRGRPELLSFSQVYKAYAGRDMSIALYDLKINIFQSTLLVGREGRQNHNRVLCSTLLIMYTILDDPYVCSHKKVWCSVFFSTTTHHPKTWCVT